MRRTRGTALLLALAGVFACASTKSEHVLTGTQRAAYGGDVRIVMEGAPVGGDYEEIAILSATGTGAGASLPSIVSALQREAAGLGCDSVVHVRYDRGAESATATGIGVRRQR